MSNSEAHSKNEEDVNNEEAVVTQIGEDPGLPADTMVEQDSKSMDNEENKQRKGTNRSKKTEE